MINIAREKNKVFFGVKFGSGRFCFYIFNRKGAGWGKSRTRKRKQLVLGVFRKRGKTASNKYLTRRDGFGRPFFYILPQPLFAATMNCFSVLNLKIGI